MIEKSEAIRLADWCEANSSGIYRPSAEAAAELRRLHDDNRRLVNTLNHVSEVRSLLVEQRDELLEALKGFVAIATDSDGVAGYHLNGDIAEWASFPEWHEAHAAIAKAKGEQR